LYQSLTGLVGMVFNCALLHELDELNTTLVSIYLSQRYNIVAVSNQTYRHFCMASTDYFY